MWRMLSQPARRAVPGNTLCTYAGNLNVSPEHRMNMVREHQLCFNCLKSGHFAPQCASDRKCQKCRKPHHTLLLSSFECDCMVKMADEDTRKLLPAKRDDSCTSHCSHLSSPNFGGQQSLLMMTCQITVVMSDGRVTKARALLDCTLSTSFVTERLARRLQLPRQFQRVQVAGIGGAKHKLSSRYMMTLTVAYKKSVNSKYGKAFWASMEGRSCSASRHYN